MFSFFKKKNTAPKIQDVVFSIRSAKWKALSEAARQLPQPIFVAWFNESMEQLSQHLLQHQQQATIITYRQVHSGTVTNSPIIFIEHYPLHGKEQQVFDSLINNKVSFIHHWMNLFLNILVGTKFQDYYKNWVLMKMKR